MMFMKGKVGYIANRIGIETVDTRYDTVEVEIFDKPFHFKELYMPITDQYSLQKYGSRASRMLRMFVPIKKWYKKINVGDRAYLVDENTEVDQLNNIIFEDTKYCNNANYKVISVELQNMFIKIEFEKIKENEDGR